MASPDTSQGAQNQPFRFLDLPLEVRNAIYNVILCSPPPATLRNTDQEDLLPMVFDPAYFTHPRDTNILLVNRQIHAEATDAMLRGNQLVRIRADVHDYDAQSLIDNIFIHSQLPVLRLRRAGAEDPLPKGLVLTHTITGPSDPPGVEDGGDDDDDYDVVAPFVILRRDLDAFCRLLALRGSLMDEAFAQGRYAHVIEVHNPFGDATPSRDFMGERNQERLLRPYRDHLRGGGLARRFAVCGHVSAPVAASIEAAVAEAPLSREPEEVLAGLRRSKDAGNGHFRRREFGRAAEAYATGVHAVERLRRGDGWAATRARGGPAFLGALAETLCQTHLNATQNILTCLREAPPWRSSSRASSYRPSDDEHDDDYDARAAVTLRRPFAERAEAHVLAAERVGERLETDWRPTLAQMAKWSFRMATVQRALGRMESAKAYIDRARLQAPADPLVRREAEEIEDLVRSRAGLGRLLA